MYDKKKACVLFSLIILFVVIPTTVFAEPEQGKNYDVEKIGLDAKGNDVFVWTSTAERILDANNQYRNYILEDTATVVKLKTMSSGSLIFDKATCTYDIYNAGHTEGQTAKIKNISWTVKGKLNTTSSWSAVNQINNAACTVSVDADTDSVRITGTKTASVGTTQIVIDHTFSMGFKETIRAYNNNPAWTNHNIGFTQSFEVPRVIHFGTQTFDLADYNGTTLNRNWIINNEAKLVKLTDKINYDFGIGFDNLDNIKITWDGAKAKLALNYLYGGQIVPYQTWFEVDPTWGYSTSSLVYTAETTGSAVSSCATGVTKTGPLDGQTLRKYPNTDPTGYCRFEASQWNISGIPDSGILITSVNLRLDVSATVSDINCDVTPVAGDITTQTAAQLMTDIQDGTPYVSNNTYCKTQANDVVLSLGSSGITAVTAARSVDRFAIGIVFTDRTRDGSTHSLVTSNKELQVVYSIATPNRVSDLSATALNYSAVFLDWSQPSDIGWGSIIGYQINYTTPYSGTVNTVITNNTGTSATAATVTSLTENTPYTFRIGIQTTAGYNMTGNKANVTTPYQYTPVNFTIGSFDVSGENSERMGIIYQRDDINSTQTVVSVIYDSTYTVDCDILYRLSQTETTYQNLSGTGYSTSQDIFDFIFNDSGNEVITIDCRDRDTNDTARYVITQDGSFVLLDMIENFRNGAYGTTGMFGSLDLITLLIIVISMIGFNRVNETVGAIFCAAIIGFTAYFEIITFPTIFLGAIILIVMLVVTTTRKD